jgi:hypothetical protein
MNAAAARPRARAPPPQMFNESTIDFQSKVLARSGLGEETYLPPCEWPPGPGARDAAQGRAPAVRLPCSGRSGSRLAHGPAADGSHSALLTFD